MAFGDVSAPTRFLKGQHASDNRSLALEVFGGEVLTAFDLALQFGDKVETKSVGGGQKSWRFPKTWKATAEYHTPGQELLGNPIETGEITITADDLLTASVGIADLDRILSHFDVSSKFSAELGRALARIYDKNTARQIILAARTAAAGPFPGGSSISSNTLKPTAGVYDGLAWINAIRDMNDLLYGKDVPEDMQRYAAVPKGVFNAMKFAKDGGVYILQNRELNQGENGGGFTGRKMVLDVDGVMVFPTRNIPNTNETADSTVYAKYRADYSKTLGVFWTSMACATVKLKDVSIETTRDVRRREDFIVADTFVGHGTLRPECAGEFSFVS